jgi:hypothetical protein
MRWKGLPPSESTWEPVDEFRAAFPEFQLEDELFVDDVSDVMVGRVYQRRHMMGDAAATPRSPLPQD